MEMSEKQKEELSRKEKFVCSASFLAVGIKTYHMTLYHWHLKHSEFIELKHLNAFTPASLPPTSKSSKKNCSLKIQMLRKI